MNLLFKKVDNSSIIVFRFFFGLLMSIESFGAILSGWVYKTFVEPSYSFPFFGFEFTQLLLGKYYYFHFFIMGVISIFILLGYYYRIATILLTFLWGIVYFGQKIHYNNHYYLVLLLCFFMSIIPANKSCSLDVKYRKIQPENSTPYWTILIFIIQISIVYFYAAIAKFYPGWLENKFLSLRLSESARWFIDNFKWYSFANFLKNPTTQYFMTVMGILFDLFIIPILIYRKTRLIGLLSMFIFHIFNSIVLQIGIFPYLALSFSIFFFDRKTIHSLFLVRHKHFYNNKDEIYKPKTNYIIYILGLYFIVQIILPIRHFFIPGDVIWTEEGHRVSWRMMLRSKSGILNLDLYDSKNEFIKNIPLENYLTSDQIETVKVHPDLIYSLIQIIKKDPKLNLKPNYKIYANSQISINGGIYNQYINPKVDLTKIKWSYLAPNSWILPEPKKYY